jgi:RHS repeat-associated protein
MTISSLAVAAGPVPGSVRGDASIAGEQVDSGTGLQYLRARYYDMATGRFISRDPWPGTKYQPSSDTFT